MRIVTRAFWGSVIRAGAVPERATTRRVLFCSVVGAVRGLTARAVIALAVPTRATVAVRADAVGRGTTLRAGPICFVLVNTFTGFVDCDILRM